MSVGAVPVDLTTSDPNLRRYVNVVQEMSLAAGVPVPRLFVLESERGKGSTFLCYLPFEPAARADRSSGSFTWAFLSH